MTVPATYTPTQQACNGSVQAFPFTFGVGSSSEIEVVLTTVATGAETILTLTTHYTVSALNNDFSAGGTVTTVATYSSAYTITIRMKVPVTQEASFTQGSGTLYEDTEAALDKLTRIAQQNAEKLNRAVLLPKSDVALITELPSAVDRASKYLAFDSEGQPIASGGGAGSSEVPVSSVMETVIAAASTGDALTILGFSAFIQTLIGNATEGAARLTLGADGFVQNVQLSRDGTSNNKLWVYARSLGTVPNAANPIRVMIPDLTGATMRSRSASYLSGTSSFTLADGTSYWNKGSLNGEVKNAYLYAIWDGTGIVWALAGYSGYTMVPTTTTATDDDYFLPEDSSTYTRSNSHYCVCVARIRYEYDTGDTPDHTIQVSVENAPNVVWNPKSDYAKTATLAATDSVAGGDMVENSRVSFIVRQTGTYMILGQAMGADTLGNGTTVMAYIRTGSATYGAATLQTTAKTTIIAADGVITATTVPVICRLSAGDTVHLGASVTGSGTRSLKGDNYAVGSTRLTAWRID